MNAPNYTDHMTKTSASVSAGDKPSRHNWLPRARDHREGRVVCWIVASMLLIGYGSRALLGWGWSAIAAACLVGVAGLALFGRWQRRRATPLPVG